MDQAAASEAATNPQTRRARLRTWRPGLRTVVLLASGLLVAATAFFIAVTVADNLKAAAVAQAVSETEAVVAGDINPLLDPAGLTSVSSTQRAAVNAELVRLTNSGHILRIKVWALDGTILFSDLPALRNHSFGPPADDLLEVFAGESSHEFSDGSDPENIFEHGLASEFLSIYLPIQPAGASAPIGAYEIYEDAAPILAAAEQTRWQVLGIVGLMAGALLGLLALAFAGASQLLAQQNRQLREKALREKLLTTDLRQQTLHDTLTGLANRVLFADRLDHALARAQRTGHQPAVLFIDLDDFKTVNDSLGHGEGDRLLVSVAERFTATLRPEDTVARLGGDEFAVLIEDQSGESTALEVAERVLACLTAPFTQASKDLFVRASIGLALADGSKTADELLRDADLSMYAAKDRGKGRIEIFEPALAAAAKTRLLLKGDLEKALERREFELLYQPIVDMNTGFVASVEALIRWDHATLGRLNPVDFIPLAEETGAIVPIGAWCLETAARQVLAWDALGGPRVSVSVNVCSRQIALGPVFVAQVADILARTGLEPARLSLEVTESMLMADTEAVVATTRALKTLGVQLSLDDFGTGYSSLSYLRRFPFDSLKIDRSFVMAMDTSPEQLSLTGSILKLATDLHLKTVAEGIEEPMQLTTLCALGTDYGQGFLFARPLTVAACGELLAAGGRLDPLGAQGLDSCEAPGVVCPLRTQKSCVKLCPLALVAGGQLQLKPAGDVSSVVT